MSSFVPNSFYAVNVNGTLKRSLTFQELKNPNPKPTIPPFIFVNLFLSDVISFPSEAHPDISESTIQAVSEKYIVTLSDNSLESLYITRHTEVEALTSMGVPASEHSRIIDSIAVEADSMIASARSDAQAPPGFIEVPISSMSISVEIHRIFQFQSSADMQNAMMELVDSRSNNTIPASRSSIRMLERGRQSRFEESTCTICLDDIGSNMEFLRMPCKHVFHVDCIEKWLSQSHFCPTCRYHMPVDN